LIGDFALPMGIVPKPGRHLEPPVQGYTVAYAPADEDQSDTYSFHVVVSHERLKPLLHDCFSLLPDRVYGIVEIGSRDAYRSTDVFIGESNAPMSLAEFRRVWSHYESILLEDGSIAAGANSEDPQFVEVFLDQWKGLSIHVPLHMRDELEDILQRHGLEEVAQTWPDEHEPEDADPESPEATEIRPVLNLDDEQNPDLDELLLNLRHDWRLELNVDPETNVDESGRHLGRTLWHAVVIVDKAGTDEPAENGSETAYASVWATAESMDEMETLIDQAMEEHPDWQLAEIYTLDRVAFDERPDELADLRPHQRQSKVHLVRIEPWSQSPPELNGSVREDAGDETP